MAVWPSAAHNSLVQRRAAAALMAAKQFQARPAVVGSMIVFTSWMDEIGKLQGHSRE